MRSLALALLAFCVVARAQVPDWVYAEGPFAAGIVSAAHPSGALISLYADQVFLSWDDGVTWTLQGAYPVQEYALVVLVDGRLLSLSGGNVIRSDNLGATWEQVASLGTYLSHLDLAPDDTLYAASSNTVYQSDDEGQTTG